MKLLRRLLFGLVLALCSVPAYAENWLGLEEHWVKIASMVDTKEIIYADANSLAIRPDHSSGRFFAQFTIKNGDKGIETIATTWFDECLMIHSGTLTLSETKGNYSRRDVPWQQDGPNIEDAIGGVLCAVATDRYHADQNKRKAENN